MYFWYSSSTTGGNWKRSHTRIICFHQKGSDQFIVMRLSISSIDSMRSTRAIDISSMMNQSNFPIAVATDGSMFWNCGSIHCFSLKNLWMVDHQALIAAIPVGASTWYFFSVCARNCQIKCDFQLQAKPVKNIFLPSFANSRNFAASGVSSFVMQSIKIKYLHSQQEMRTLHRLLF